MRVFGRLQGLQQPARGARAAARTLSTSKLLRAEAPDVSWRGLALGGAAGVGALALLTGSRERPGAARAEEVVSKPGDGSRVFVWGQRAAFPVSGPGPDSDVRLPAEAGWFQEHAEQNNCRWRQLAFGPSFGVARTDRGELFIWGSVGSKNGKGRTFLEPRPLYFEELGDKGRFRDVQCSESAIWAMTPDGEVIVWERVPTMLADRVAASSSPTKLSASFRGGRRLDGMDRPIRQMSVGPSHAAFLTDHGKVYCLGSNRYGECGADPAKFGIASSCRLVQFPRHVEPVARVRCGRSHTVAIGAEGQVLSWGDDSRIQLGLGDTRSNTGDERPWEGSRGYQNFMATGESMAPPAALRGGPSSPGFSKARSTASARYGEFEAHAQWKPSLVMDIPLEFERQVHGTPYPPPDGLVCGDDFTMLMVRDSPDWFSPAEESNRLFCCGENGRGQCGRSLQTSQQIFSATKLPRNSYTESVSCGGDHCLAVMRRVGHKKRELWAWGSNEKGQAGAGAVGATCPAARLRLPKGIRAEAAWCGFHSSAVVCNDRSEPPILAPAAPSISQRLAAAEAARLESGAGELSDVLDSAYGEDSS